MNTTPEFHVGEIVCTSYSSGTYRIVEIDGPCTCRCFNDDLNNLHSAGSQPHFHLTCVRLRQSTSKERGTHHYYLNGYRHDGTNVWSNDYLVFPFRSQPHMAIHSFLQQNLASK